MKRLFSGLIAGVSAVLLLVGCSNEQTGKESKIVAPNDFAQVFSDPESYKGDTVDFKGEVFTLDKKDGGYVLYLFADTTEGKKDILVTYKGEQELKENDQVQITATITDVSEIDGQKVPVAKAEKLEMK